MGNFFGAAETVKRDAAGEDCWVEICGSQSEVFGRERLRSGVERGRRWEGKIRGTRTEEGWRRSSNKRRGEGAWK
jgi:hypothetical protein